MRDAMVCDKDGGSTQTCVVASVVVAFNFLLVTLTDVMDGVP